MNVRAVWGVAGVAALVAGCSAPGPGHLGAPTGYSVCFPAGDADQALFGVILTNEGSEPITLETVRAVDTLNVTDLSIAVDLEVASTDDMIGAAHNPADDPADQPALDALLARLVEPAGARIEPGAVAEVIVMVTPTDPGADAGVSHFNVSYREGGHTHWVKADGRLTLAASASCAS